MPPAARSHWGGMVLDRLRDQENRGAVIEYNGAQTVAGRNLEIDLRPNSGTMNDIPEDQVATCIGLSLDHRQNTGVNRWQFYRHGIQLFELIFSAN